jgi:chorismate dehydratase
VASRVRISVVKYLNSVPLAWGILEGPNREDFDARFSTPAECADQLAAGEVDIGLIPSIEYQRIQGSRIVAGPAIVSLHRALSVFLLSLVPLFRVRTVGFDPASRTSEALSRVIFREFYGTDPKFTPSAPDPEKMLEANDAALLIGDVALRYQAANRLPSPENQQGFLRDGPEPVQNFDLAERWNNLTGLPFVFAFWAARPGFRDRTAEEKLLESRAYGLEHLDVIAARYSESLGLDEEFLRVYLTRNLDYHMDSKAVEALQEFYGLARKHRILRAQRDIEFL